MANTINAGLKREKILNFFLAAFTARLTALRAFSIDMSPDEVSEGDSVSVPYVPMAAAAEDFGGSYSTKDSSWLVKKVAIDSHKWVGMHLTDLQMANTPYASLEQQAEMKAYQLALAVWLDIMSVVTAANFANATNIGAAAGFDLDDIADLGGILDDRDVPDGMRGLILARAYHTNVVKDDTLADQSKAGPNQVLSESRLPRIHGFNPYKSTKLPKNGENLVGIACVPSAIGVGVRYLMPQDGNTYHDARALTDPDTGLTIGFRDWYDNDTGTRKQIFECNYGFGVIEAAGLQRLTSE